MGELCPHVWWVYRDTCQNCIVAAAREEGRREGLKERDDFSKACWEGVRDAVREESRREGYAECQRDVVAWLVASVPDGGGAGGQTLEATVGRERARDLRRAILAAARAIGLGNHVGKAKGGDRE